MLCNTRQPSPLEAYAKSVHDEGSADEQVLFPMYTVRLEAVLQMTTVEPHEVLKLQKLLVEFEPKLGKALFVSHQWVGKRHPDPEFTQFSVLQDALKHMMSELQRVDLDVRTEVALPSAKAFVTRALKTEPIYVWYDYFSCPQLEHISSHGDVAPLDSGGMSNLAKAVSSIPLYVATCTFFFALCPSLESEDHSQMLNPHSWASRGWCRVERCCRELSPEHSWVMIRSATQTELISSPVATPGAGAPGEGVFTVEADRQRLGPVMLKALQRKLHFLLKCGDLVGYRVLLNHQPLFLRGFNVETVYDFIPGYDKGLSLETGASSLVSKFFYHNGFSKIHEVDEVGWTPLHYAGCRGDPQLVRALLELRANPNVKAAKDNVMAGALPKWRVMTSISACRHHEAARILIEAKADLSGTQLVGACIGNDPEGIRILCEVGGVSPHAADHEGGHGVLAIHLACMYGATAALEELVAQAARGKQSVDLSNILWLATSFGNCSAEMVDFLVKLKADVNEQWNLPLTNPLGLLVRVTSLRHRFGTPTHFTRMAFHAKGATPLMQAVMGGQWEAAAALVARGARIDARNARGYTAADLARSPPAFLAQAFQGDSRGCLRVVSLELASVDSPAETKEEAEEAEADDELIQLYF